MRRALAAALCALALVAVRDTPARAWGFEIHRFITERALAQLPPELQPFYQKHRVFVIEHAVDPDLWRSAGFEQEPPRHFVDLDVYGKWPFTELPRDYELAVAKFGREKVDEERHVAVARCRDVRPARQELPAAA